MITAFDLATITGVCDGDSKPRVWTWDLHDAGPPDDRPHRLGLLSRFIVKYLDAHKPSLIVYEAPMPLSAMMQRGSSEETVAFLRGSIGVLEAICGNRNIPVEGVTPQKARQSVLGWYTNKTGEKTKPRVIREVTMLGLRGIDGEAPSENECDAYVVWQWAINRLNPRLAHLQTPLFRGGQK